ncbi:MAG TPA: hypothetical protein VNP92_34805 [Actinophytocola sp.]|nr:hypothetical protein [Actinophytocola sp.]
MTSSKNHADTMMATSPHESSSASRTGSAWTKRKVWLSAAAVAPWRS